MVQQDEDNFAAMFEAQGAQTKARLSKRVRPGQLVEGTIVEVGSENVFVDIGAKTEGRIDRAQLLDKEGALKVKVGDRLRATVSSVSGDGIQLVVAIGKGGIDTQSLELALQSGVPVEGAVSKAVKAGLEVEIGGVRAFCPASQVDLGFAQDLERFVGTRHFFKVIEVRDGGRSVIVSRKAVLKDERENQARAVRERLVVGAELEGIVQTLQPYGAFIDLGGIEGLVHISELGHGRVDKVGDVVKVGETVKVRVLAVEPKGTSPTDLKVSLSMKSADQPAEAAPATDEVLAGKVSQVTNFGVFVDTEKGRGLVPMSELGLPPNADPKRAFPVGKEVEVVVLGRSGGDKLRFSIQGVAVAEERSNYKSFSQEARRGGSGKSLGSLGDLLQGLKDKVPEGKQAPAKAQAQQAPAAAPDRGQAQRRRV